MELGLSASGLVKLSSKELRIVELLADPLESDRLSADPRLLLFTEPTLLMAALSWKDIDEEETEERLLDLSNPSACDDLSEEAGKSDSS